MCNNCCENQENQVRQILNFQPPDKAIHRDISEVYTIDTQKSKLCLHKWCSCNKKFPFKSTWYVYTIHIRLKNVRWWYNVQIAICSCFCHEHIHVKKAVMLKKSRRSHTKLQAFPDSWLLEIPLSPNFATELCSILEMRSIGKKKTDERSSYLHKDPLGVLSIQQIVYLNRLISVVLTVPWSPNSALVFLAFSHWE